MYYHICMSCYMFDSHTDMPRGWRPTLLHIRRSRHTFSRQLYLPAGGHLSLLKTGPLPGVRTVIWVWSMGSKHLRGHCDHRAVRLQGHVWAHRNRHGEWMQQYGCCHTYVLDSEPVIQYPSFLVHQNSIQTHAILMNNKWRILYNHVAHRFYFHFAKHSSSLVVHFCSRCGVALLQLLSTICFSRCQTTPLKRQLCSI